MARAFAPFQWRGVVVATAVLVSWGAHLYWCLAYAPPMGWTTPIHIALQSFLNVGLFITAHDAIHGTLAPGRRRLNDWFGATAIFAYGAFLWPKMRRNHHAHHDAPVSAEDPDYAAEGDERFIPWLRTFFSRYYSWGNFALMHIWVAVAFLISGSLAKLLIYWAAPAWLSALQLFVFGVYLPHRTPKGGHRHPHNAVTLDFPVWLSFLTCYHFGYHQEHHDHPAAPWWRLPLVRAASKLRSDEYASEATSVV